MIKIKSITTYVQDENFEDGKAKISREIRDENGSVLIEENYDEEEALEQRVEREFDAEKKIVKELQFSSEENPDQTIIYNYDSDGKVIQIQEHFSDGSVTNKNFKRDVVNHSVSIDLLDEEGVEEGREFRQFDSDGKLLEEAVFEEGNLHHRVQVKYNDEGRPIERSVEDGEGYQDTFFYNYEIDEKGRVGTVKISDKNNQVIKVEQVKYDERGNQLEYLTRDVKQGWGNLEKWEYDDKDRILVHQVIAGDGSVREEVINAYNEHGFLIQKETRTGHGVMINFYEYEWFGSDEEE